MTYSRGDGADRGASWLRRGRPGNRGALWPVVLFALVASALLVGVNTPAARARQNDASLTINRPEQGPAGANVVAAISGASHSETFALGYAAQTPGCLVGFTAIPDAPSVTTDDSGNRTFAVVWPTGSGVGSFYVCARDTQNLTIMLQSTQPYNVLSATAPSIVSVTPAPTSTTTPTSAPTATPGTTFTAGEQVVVHGSGFLPGGTGIVIYISGTPNPPSPQDTLLSQGPTNTDTAGDFSVTVLLPTDTIGTRYLHAVTPDGTSDQPPSLHASVSIVVGLQPTPTPSPSPSPSPSPTSVAPPVATPTPTP